MVNLKYQNGQHMKIVNIFMAVVLTLEHLILLCHFDFAYSIQFYQILILLYQSIKFYQCISQLK